RPSPRRSERRSFGMCCPGKKKAPPPPPKASDAPPGKTKEPCPEITLSELKEIVKSGGSETPQAPAARRQYINLDDQVDAGNPHPEYGRVIRVKAKIQWA